MPKRNPITNLKREIRAHRNSANVINHICLLLVYKYLSDDLEKYVQSNPDENIKECALKDKGYYIEPMCYFSSIAMYNNGIIGILEDCYNRILINSMGYAGEEILNSIFKEVDFRSIDSPIDDESVSKLVKIIYEMDFNEINISELFKELYKYKKYPSLRHSRELGISTLYDLLIQIILVDKKQADSIYNPNVNGGFLLSYFLQKYDISKIYGQEKDLDMYKFDLMNLIVNGVDFKDINIAQGDCLSSSKFFNERFDIAVSETPFSIRYGLNSKDLSFFIKLYGVEKFKSNCRRAEFPFIIHMLHQLKDDGVMVVIARQNILFRTFDENIKECLINEKNYLDTIILLPETLLESHLDNFSILIFKKNKTTKDIFFIDASNEVNTKLTDKNMEKIIDAYANKKVIDKFSYLASIDEIKENDYNLTVSRYIDTFDEDTVELEEVLSKKLKLAKELDEVNKDIDYWLKKLNFN